MAAVLLSVFMLSACGEKETSPVPSDDFTVTETSAEALEEFDDGLDDSEYSEMIRRSFVSAGNTARLTEKLGILESGGEITIGFLGGSITEGYTVNKDQCYAKLTYDLLCEKYPTGRINYVNAGISGTPSILGNLRVKRDIIDKGADIVFVEYAVNDGSDKIYRESYDSLIMTLLKQENAPAVILLLNRTEEGHTAQEYMKDIGEYYDLGMISTADALTPALESGFVSWSDYYNDASHPSPAGHKLFLEFISYYFDRAAAENRGEYSVKPIGRHGAPYENALLAEADYDNSDSRLVIDDIGCFDKAAEGLNGFRCGWAYNSESEGGKMTFKATGNSVFLICNRKNSDSMGKLEVYLDGEHFKTIDLNDKDGWGDPWAYQIIKRSTVKEMKIEIAVSEGYEDKKTEILGIAVSSNESVMM